MVLKDRRVKLLGNQLPSAGAVLPGRQNYPSQHGIHRKNIAGSSKGWIEQNLENKKVLGKSVEVEWNKMVIYATEELRCMQLKVVLYYILYYININIDNISDGLNYLLTGWFLTT